MIELVEQLALPALQIVLRQGIVNSGDLVGLLKRELSWPSSVGANQGSRCQELFHYRAVEDVMAGMNLSARTHLQGIKIHCSPVASLLEELLLFHNFYFALHSHIVAS